MQLTPDEEAALRWWISWTIEDMEDRQRHWKKTDEMNCYASKGSSIKSQAMIDTIKNLQERFIHTTTPKRVFL